MAVHSMSAVFYTVGLTQTADPEQSYGPTTTDLCNDTHTMNLALLTHTKRAVREGGLIQ
jgi:hypothetical protein